MYKDGCRKAELVCAADVRSVCDSYEPLLHLHTSSSSSRMRVIYHNNWSATKQRPHPQSACSRDKPPFSFISPLHSTPPFLGRSPSEYATPFGVGKLEWWGYPIVKKTLRMYNRDRISACDIRTDRRTSCDGIVRAVHTGRTIKTRGNRGGGTVLKVGGGASLRAERAKKIFWPPPTHFLASGGDKILLR